MRKLYPPIEVNKTFMVPRSGGHTLYLEESGNPEGVPVVFLHGGPGAGCEPWHRQFFHPQQARIILFDQRGCGRSTPHASLTENTTQHLVEDLEYLRAFLGVEHWIVFGGSWGSTLALAYAEAHPQRCLGLILRGIFLCRKADIQWFYQEGASRIFPEAWEAYCDVIPHEERQDMVAAYYRRLTSEDRQERLRAAKQWSLWEGRALSLLTNPKVENYFAKESVALSLARIECHYFINEIFLPPEALLTQAQNLHDIPGVIIHGRYDMVCPIDQALALSRVWTTADLQVIPTAGHAASEPDITNALVSATDSMLKKFIR